jgi:hypothetical protein
VYVRLKHGLSALALAAIRRPAQGVHRDAALHLAAFCDLAAAGDGPSALAAPARLGARAAGAGPSRALQRLLRLGLLERRDGAVGLPAEFQPHFSYLNRQVHRLAGLLRGTAPRTARSDRTGRIRRGLALFDAGLFFECHEYFEDIWRRAPAADRDFCHGVILIAAGFYHCEKGNRHGARVKLASGMRHLERFLPAAGGVHLDRWLAKLHPWMARIESGDPIGPLDAREIPSAPPARRGARRQGSLTAARITQRDPS